MYLLLTTDTGYRSYETLCTHHLTGLFFFCFVDILEYFPDSYQSESTRFLPYFSANSITYGICSSIKSLFPSHSKRGCILQSSSWNAFTL